MKTHETSTESRISPEQFGEVMGPISAAVQVCRPVDLQYWVGRKSELVKKIVALLTRARTVSADFIVEIQSWLTLYREEFGIELDFAALQIPEYQEGTWLVIADERLSNNQVYEACVKRFSCERYTYDLNTIRDLHVKGTTARRFLVTVEADPERKNQSADDIKRQELTPKAITLKERMLLELWHFRTTGKHLDVMNITLCSGSRHPDGNFPYVGLSSVGVVSVHWCDSSLRRGHLRSRQAVS